MVQVKEAEAVVPRLSVAVTLTVLVCLVEGVPEMSPVFALMMRPDGRLDAAYLMVADGAVSDATIWRVSGTLRVEVLAPGLVTLTDATYHVKDVLPVAELRSVARTLTLKVPPAEGVPLMVPVVALIDRPVGSPVADQDSFCRDWLSVAELARESDLPLALVLAEIGDTTTVLPATLLTVQVNEVVLELPVESVALTTTGEPQTAAEGVPEI